MRYQLWTRGLLFVSGKGITRREASAHVYIDRELLKRVKVAAVHLDQTAQDVTEAAVRAWLDEYDAKLRAASLPSTKRAATGGT